jgi:hypothetical protein
MSKASRRAHDDVTGYLPDEATLDRAGIIAILESESNRRLGISADELLRQQAAGELKSPGSVGDLLVLADLLDDGDPLREPGPG